MDDKFVPELSVPENVTKTLLLVSNSASLEKALEKLIEIAKVPDRRFDLSTKNVVTVVLQLCRSLLSPSWRHLLLLSLKVLRNMCAGEMRNQNAFLEQRGVETVMDVITSVGLTIDPDCEIIRIGLQLLGNYSVAGREHQCDVWYQLFPHRFLKIAGVRSREICDPLCMVIYTCCEGTDGLLTELSSEQGLPILNEIICTSSVVGLREDWLKLLLSKICIEGSYFSSIFFKLHSHPYVENNDIITHLAYQFVSEQAHLLSILSEILNEQLEHIVVSHVFALSIFGILKSAAVVVDFSTRGKDDLPTGSAPNDVLGYSLVILRDICACGHLTSSKEEGPKDVVDILVSSGLIELLLDLLRSLEPPTTIRKAMTQDQIKEAAASSSLRCCPYKGFRRDIVAILGNCAYRRRHIQDEIRDKNGILLLLQQCVTDDDNPFLREWGIWCVRNLLEGNAENQGVVADLELQGTADVPELARLGLQVEVDPKTRRAKLVNVA
uniref:Ataxin-10 isoform X1 n=2 Tax=Nicotiana tabacum TaxID=4097 RepID=A0A1S3X7S7_TOBAC|nr:PREDICTED: ataxin-10-like isoform X1 [Nicotiana tabacum]XP_016435804.1 PREDICTED: ataxin-10-like isoform X1 [Nicotiana tabacum]